MSSQITLWESASLISSVLGLKASHQTAIFFPARFGIFSLSFCTGRDFCISFTLSALAIILKSYPCSFPDSTSAFTSFGRQLQPYHPPAERKFFPILSSRPSHFATSRISAPTCSAKFAISLIKEIFVARKLFAAYLISSLLAISVKRSCVCVLSNGR